jgi:hypothetical protein
MREPISCAECQEKLAIMHLNEFPPDEREELLEHLISCSGCTAVRKEYEVMDTVIDNALVLKSPVKFEDVWKRFEQKITGVHRVAEVSGQASSRRRNIRRSLFIGLGGTGNEVVRRLKRDMQRHGFDSPLFQYLVMDTLPFDEKPDMDPLMRLRNGEEYLYIGNYNPNEVLKNLDSWPVIGSWWGNRTQTSLATVDEGAGQMRAVGRMGFFYHFNSIASLLKRITQKLMSASARETSIEQGVDVVDQEPIVYLVFSLCGGTGSSLFLDVAYVLRQLLAFSATPPTITGVALLPGPYLQVIESLPQQERLQGNAYAALMELEQLHIMALRLKPRPNGKDLWNVQYSPNFQVTSGELPFDYFYLLDDTTTRGEKYTREQLFEKTAQAIFWLSGPSTSTAFWEQTKNLSNKILAGQAPLNSSGSWQLPIYGSLGISTVRFEEHVDMQRELESRLTEYLYTQEGPKLALPSSLSSVSWLIEELSGEQSGVNAIPPEKELRLTGNLSDQATLNDMLENFTSKYQMALNRLLISPVWKKTSEQYLRSMQKAIGDYAHKCLCNWGPIALRQGLEEVTIQLDTLLTELVEKQQKQRILKANLESEYLERSSLDSDSIFQRIVDFFEGSSSQGRILKRAKVVARQRYLWYDAGYKTLIYGDIIDSILQPLIAYTKEQKKILEKIDSGLQIWLARNKHNNQTSLRTHEPATLDRIRLRLSGGEAVQQAIQSGKISLVDMMKESLQRTFALGLDREQNFAEELIKNIKDVAAKQCSLLQEKEDLAKRLLGEDMVRERFLFLEGAECLWGFARGNIQQLNLSRESIDLLGYGINPERDVLLEVGQSVLELCKELPIRPILIATDIRDEMVFIKTLHGLTISSLHTIEQMRQAYSVMKVMRHSPYIHINYADQQRSAYEPSADLALTPRRVIETWQDQADRLVVDQPELVERIREVIGQYELASEENLGSLIGVDNPQHPFFDLIDGLREVLMLLPKNELRLQILTKFVDLEAVLYAQGWIRIDPAYYERFNPSIHRVHQDEQRSVTKLSRIIDVVQPGYIRYQEPTSQVRHALVIVSTQISAQQKIDTNTIDSSVDAGDICQGE